MAVQVSIFRKPPPAMVAEAKLKKQSPPAAVRVAVCQVEGETVDKLRDAARTEVGRRTSVDPRKVTVSFVPTGKIHPRTKKPVHDIHAFVPAEA